MAEAPPEPASDVEVAPPVVPDRADVVARPSDAPPAEPSEAFDTALPDTGLQGAPPTCRITSPDDGARVLGGTAIRFSGEVEDVDDDVISAVWASDLWGPMVVGTNFEFILPRGRHQVTLTATDASGHRCEETVLVVVGL